MGCGFSAEDNANKDNSYPEKLNVEKERKSTKKDIYNVAEIEIQNMGSHHSRKKLNNNQSSNQNEGVNHEEKLENSLEAADTSSAGERRKLKQPHLVPDQGTIQMPHEISVSQVNFFKMLDEKIENGIAFDEEKEEELRREEMKRSLEEWDSILSRSLDYRNDANHSSLKESVDGTSSKSEQDQNQQASVSKSSGEEKTRISTSAASTRSMSSLPTPPPEESDLDEEKKVDTSDRISNNCDLAETRDEAYSPVVQEVSLKLNALKK